MDEDQPASGPGQDPRLGDTAPGPIHAPDDEGPTALTRAAGWEEDPPEAAEADWEEPLFSSKDFSPLPIPARDPWDSLPASEGLSGTSGRQVRRVLSLAAWKHYRNLRFVAEGGMGRIFKAYDPTLKRIVALKFLRRDEPDLVARFALEAQHQARIEHPNICRVYEVGEWEDQSYIAMQFVKGQTLEMLRPSLTRLEIVRVMETVAEAIHAAHHTGLIHRDLKPANIMVHHEEGRLVPTILDFGLARGHENQQLTQQGIAVGTLHYMAPEQARGDHARIDRRTDVYGLGATLHKALTGDPPFGAFDGPEVLRHAVETDVPPLRRLAPDLPEDLDTITRKCLEKDPARRYPSAQALAEDLRRWREGEPILARKPTLAYLGRSWARKHRLVVAVGAAALVATLTLAGVALATAASARTRARHAQHFGQEAERIEALLRYARLSPPHDVRTELAQVRTRMTALESEARGSGSLAAAPAAYALGRSHLALGDPEKARELLERAWSGGLRTPEVALALGRALAADYQRSLDLARALPSKELREARERELARDLRDPALARLREGAPAALESPAYHEALVAFMGGQWDLAQAQAQRALAATPWLFEAKRLEGETLLARARTLQDPKAALPLLGQAEAAFSEALRLGPSDLATALDLVLVLSERASQELASGSQAEDTLPRCRQAVALARTLRPDGGLAPAHLARVLTRWAEMRPPDEASTRAALQEASSLSTEAMALAPGDAAVQAIHIPVLLTLGMRYYRTRGLDPMPFYRQAQDLARTARQQHPQEPVFTALLANTCMRRMTWEINSGTPPWVSFEEGLSQALALRNQFPDFAGGYQGLATLWVERAEYERRHGLDPRPSVAAALEATAAAQARGLRTRNPGWTEGDAHLIRGQYLLAIEGAGEEDFARAAEGYQRALQANPNLLEAHNGMAEAALGRAESLLQRDADPRPALGESEVHLAQLDLRNSPAPGQTDFLRGLASLLKGRLRLKEGTDPSADWSQAVSAFRRALRHEPMAKAFSGEAEAWARIYQFRGQPGDRLRAKAAAQKALGKDPMAAEAWLWMAAVDQEALRRGHPEAEEPARKAWAKTLALDANLRRTALSLGMP